jgi:hypothetical protein
MATIEPIIVSYSELDTFRQCPLKHHLAYKMRYKKPPKADSALAKGSLYHQVMEAHMKVIKKWQNVQGTKSGRIPEKLWREVLTDADAVVRQIIFDPKTGAPHSDVHDLIWWMYLGYVEKWGINPEWKIVGVEHQIVVPLRDPRGRRSRYHLKAKMDLIVQERESGGLWVVDHKSGANLPTQMDLEIDDQFGLYTWAMREVGRPVAGSLHMANRTQRNKSFMPLDTRMGKTYLNRSEKELTNLALDAYYAARAAYPPKGQEVSRYSSPDPRSCSWKCDFKEPHLIMRTGRPPAQVLHEWGFVIDKTRH